jgi:hypothetical protein
MNYNNIDSEHQYKQCAGKDCNRKATQLIKIQYLNKFGYFCDKCKTELLDLGLVIEDKKENSGESLIK